MKKVKCCYIDENNKQCPNKAEFIIIDDNRNDPDNNTYGCTKHIGELLGTTKGHLECNSWHIYYLNNQQGKTNKKEIEKEILIIAKKMGIESLSPEKFEKFKDVLYWLKKNRHIGVEI